MGESEPPDHPMRIGTAYEAGWDPAGLAVWRLTVEGADVPGRWVIVDREFRRCQGIRCRAEDRPLAGVERGSRSRLAT
jgi:hypothetical protein